MPTGVKLVSGVSALWSLPTGRVAEPLGGYSLPFCITAAPACRGHVLAVVGCGSGMPFALGSDVRAGQRSSGRFWLQVLEICPGPR